VPVAEPAIATALLPDTQVPPGDEFVKVAADPAQIDELPLLGGKAGLTVTTLVA
jgi:hypothetical protein